MIKNIKGDLVKMAKNKEVDVVIHQCNCFHTMGGGIAKTIKKVFPEAYKADLTTKYGDKEKMGSFSCVNIKNVLICNMYSQYHHGSDKIQTDYDSFRKGLQSISLFIKELEGEETMRIGLPRLIGCALAGGDWNVVEKIIEEELSHLDVVIVDFK